MEGGESEEESSCGEILFSRLRGEALAWTGGTLWGWEGDVWGNAVLGEEGEDVGFGKVETEGFEGNFEFVVVDSLVFVEVEEPELYTGTD